MEKFCLSSVKRCQAKKQIVACKVSAANGVVDKPGQARNAMDDKYRKSTSFTKGFGNLQPKIEVGNQVNKKE